MKDKKQRFEKKPLLFRGNTSNYKITTAYGGCRCDAIYLFKQSIDFKFVKKSLFPPLDKSDTKCEIFFHLNNDNISCARIATAMAAINNMIRRYGAIDSVFGQAQYAQIPMAVVGIVMKFFQIVISIVVGMAAGCIPIVGYNMGAEAVERVKELFTKLLIAEAAVGILALIIVEFFPGGLVGIFGAANESVYYTEFAVRAFRIYLCMVVFACVNKAAFIFLQAMGKAAASTMLSMVREIVFGVGFALLLPKFFDLDGVLYSMPVSDILTFLISAFVIVSTYRQLNGKHIRQQLKAERG